MLASLYWQKPLIDKGGKGEGGKRGGGGLSIHWYPTASVHNSGMGLTTLSQSKPAEARRGAKRSHASHSGTPIETMRYLLDLPSMETRHNVEQVKAYFNLMQNPKNPLHDAVKEERGENWQEASHGWAKQTIQSSMYAVSQSSTK